MYVLFLSSPENLARLDELREINRRLALDSDLEPAERERLITDGRVFGAGLQRDMGSDGLDGDAGLRRTDRTLGPRQGAGRV